ncbi:MAG: ATP-binding protein [Bacteriovoracia bacterium]
MDLLGESALIVAVAALALAITALSRNLKNKLVRYYALLCVVVSSWGFCFFLEKIFENGTFYKAHIIFNLLLAPTGLLFVRVLNREESIFTKWLFRVSVIFSFLVFVLEWTALAQEPLVRALASFSPSFLAIDCLRFVVGFRKQKQKFWIYGGALVLLAFAVMDHVPILGDVVPAIANVAICFYLFVISEAIVYQRLFNPLTLFNQLLVLFIASFCFMLLYTVFVGWIELSPALFILNSLIAAFIMVVMHNPLLRLLRFGVSRVFSKQNFEIQKKVDQALKQLNGVIDSQGLAQVTLSLLDRILDVKCATVFFLRSDGTKYRRIRGIRDEKLENREVLASNPLDEFFLKQKKRGQFPVALDYYIENEIDRSTSQQTREEYRILLRSLRSLDANVAIPFVKKDAQNQDRILGFVVARVDRLPEWAGIGGWGILLQMFPYFSRAARTLENLDVYVRMREKDRLATLGEMSAGLAHEIRNPLGAIKGAVQLIQNQSSQADSELFQVIVDEVNRLNKVVTQFLDYSRPGSYELSHHELEPLVRKTVALFEQNNDKIDVSLAYPDKKLPLVKCVPEQIRQVLVNLIHNSFNALSQVDTTQPKKIRVGLGSVEKNVYFFVEDNGMGIPKENIEKVFIPFFTTNPSGTGLGLSICSKIIEAHGGRMDIQSETAGTKGKFTRVSVHLPITNDLC